MEPPRLEEDDAAPLRRAGASAEADNDRPLAAPQRIPPSDAAPAAPGVPPSAATPGPTPARTALASPNSSPAPDAPSPDDGDRKGGPPSFSFRTLRILRPGNALISALAVLVGAYLASGPRGPSGAARAADDLPTWLGLTLEPIVTTLATTLDFWITGPWLASGPLALPTGVGVGLAALAAFAFAGAGNVRNDLTDVAVDRSAHPDRPLVTGELTPHAAQRLTVGLHAASLLAALAISWAAFLLVALALPLMELYDRRLKREGLAGNLGIGALTAAPFLLGGIAVGHVGPALASIALLAALATVGREILKDVEDARHDAAHRRTLPHRVGERRAAAVASGFLGAAILLSPLPWVLETVLGAAYLPAVVAADACFGTAALTGAGRPARAQRLVKLGMLLALVALVIGRVQGGERF